MRETEKYAAGEADDGTDCAICFCEFEETQSIRKLRCNHMFHAKCIDQWLMNHTNKCPLCNHVIGPRIVDENGHLIDEDEDDRRGRARAN